MGRWGDISGTYEQLDATAGESRQTFGLAQQFWYSPHLRVRLEANRDIATGAYGLGVKFMLQLASGLFTLEGGPGRRANRALEGCHKNGGGACRERGGQYV